MDCYGHNFVIIGSILEILDVLSSPNRVASNFGTLCDKGAHTFICVLQPARLDYSEIRNLEITGLEIANSEISAF